MNCMTTVHGDVSPATSRTDEPVSGRPAWDVRNRQVAASYLQAATRAENACARELLRRRAARLISPRPADRCAGLPY